MEKQKCLEHVVHAIQHAAVETEPFPHLIIDGFLPADLYQELSEHWPREAEAVPLSESNLMKARTAEENCPNALRLVSKFGASDSLAAGIIHPSWGVLEALLADQEVIKSLVVRLWDQISQERSDLKGKISLASEFLVQSDLDGFFLGPHLDTPRKLFSNMLYFANPGDPSDIGTSFFTPQSGRVAEHPKLNKEFIGGFHSEDEFVLEKTAPYSPNTLMCLLVTNRAFHGVKRKDRKGIVRRSVLWDVAVTVTHG